MARKKYDTSSRDKNRKKLEAFLKTRNNSNGNNDNNIKPSSSEPERNR